MDDHQAALLRELDSYLAFLKRRQEIEWDYVDALKKLSTRSIQPAELDNEYDGAPLPIPTTWRQSWADVRHGLDDEAQSHRMAAEGLDRLISKLSHFRDDRDRIRRRIREDLRTTASEYAEYKTVVNRLRKTYERKVEELQHHEDAEHLKEVHEREKDHSSGTKSPGINSDPGGWPPEHWNSTDSAPFLVAKTRNRSDSSASSSKGGTSERPSLDTHDGTLASQHHSFGSPPHNPVFVSGATSSSGSAPSAYRDPPTAKQNVFEAIAKRDWSNEKHRVNSIVRAVGSLAKGNDPAVALGPSRGTRSRQYGGKLKREAEEADRQYRAGIFQLETLRLQKQRVQSSARESLREFVTEMALTVKSVLDQRVADFLAIGYSQLAIGDRIKPAVDRVDPYRDVENYFLAVRDEGPPDQPVYYNNAFIGECRSLLFGVGLQDYCANHPNLVVPLIVQRCIAKIDASGLEVEGIYRVPGKLGTIQQIVHQMEKEEETFRFTENDDVSAVAGVLKLYLRQLPSPLFPFSAADRKAFAAECASSPDTALTALTRRIRRLSPPQQATLKLLCQHLARVAEHEHVNKMSASNLGLIFSTVVFGEDEGATLETLSNSKDTTMELLIKQQALLFEGLPTEQPPLVRSRNPSGSLAHLVQSPAETTPVDRSPALTPSPAPSSVAPVPPALAPTDPGQRQSFESVYALYQNAASSGLLVPEQHPSQPSPAPPYPPSRTSAIPVHATAARPNPHPHATVGASPLRSSSFPSTSALRVPTEPAFEPPHFNRHDLDSPSPPLSAALGRRIPSESSSSLNLS
ncbi:hypothetical protein JCM10212_005045 [Sporobolomyces blumeae]